MYSKRVEDTAVAAKVHTDQLSESALLKLPESRAALLSRVFSSDHPVILCNQIQNLYHFSQVCSLSLSRTHTHTLSLSLSGTIFSLSRFLERCLGLAQPLSKSLTLSHTLVSLVS
jgi:hypothetical protein